MLEPSDLLPRPTPEFSPHLFEENLQWSSTLTVAAKPNAVTKVNLGRASEAGLSVRQFWLIPEAALAISAINYLTFRPFIATTKNGTVTTRYFGAGVATNAIALAAEVPVRLNQKEFLNEHIEQGGVLGIEITETGTVADQDLFLQANLVRSTV